MERKQQLEDDLLILIEEFELGTGVCVSGIELTHVEKLGRLRPITVRALPVVIL